MPYTRLRYHFIFATKNRARWIWPDVESFLYPVLVRLIKRAGGHAIRLGGVEDHVHIVSALEPKVSVSDFLERIKSESSQAVRGRFKNLWGFGWQDGYGAFTLNPTDMDRILEYVENQKEHHRTGNLWLPYEKLADKLVGPDGLRANKAPSTSARPIVSRGLRRQHHRLARQMWGASWWTEVSSNSGRSLRSHPATETPLRFTSRGGAPATPPLI
jgi:REP element-mobilizing transposase RayT